MSLPSCTGSSRARCGWSLTSLGQADRSQSQEATPHSARGAHARPYAPWEASHHGRGARGAVAFPSNRAQPRSHCQLTDTFAPLRPAPVTSCPPSHLLSCRSGRSRAAESTTGILQVVVVTLLCAVPARVSGLERRLERAKGLDLSTSTLARSSPSSSPSPWVCPTCGEPGRLSPPRPPRAWLPQCLALRQAASAPPAATSGPTPPARCGTRPAPCTDGGPPAARPR